MKAGLRRPFAVVAVGVQRRDAHVRQHVGKGAAHIRVVSEIRVGCKEDGDAVAGRVLQQLALLCSIGGLLLLLRMERLLPGVLRLARGVSELCG